jgi:peptidoglycan/xylan/chitin deacetylase (PgdA/CDA1 family)
MDRTMAVAAGRLRNLFAHGDTWMTPAVFRPDVGFAVWVLLCLGTIVAAQQPPAAPSPQGAFRWPEGKRAAVSLSFDDARASLVDVGLPLLKKWGAKVTFFITPGAAEQRLGGWKQAVADGHEIANHSLTHPCTANYAFSARNALEDYDLRSMARQLDEANDRIEKLLGVRPATFAYPCGLKFVGRGLDVRSYVPLVAERFIVGRGYLDESPNDPAVTDLAQAMGTPFDEVDFAFMKDVVDSAAKEGRWVIFVGHDIGDRRHQSTETAALERLFAYLQDPANGIWMGTVAEIGTYIRKQR